MPRWIVVSLAYATANIVLIQIAGQLAMAQYVSPPDAVDVVEFFTWYGPPLLGAGQAMILRNDKSRWWEWVLAALVVVIAFHLNRDLLFAIYANV